jgi:uncharacterized protein YndB with AHSA1/START domain
MKALKIVGIIVLGLVGVVLILGLIAPKAYQVERFVIINAPRAAVFPHLQYFDKHLAWSPWTEYDPNMKVDISENDGTVGATYHWTGNDQVGEGEQKITAIQPEERVDIDLHFLKPWESKSTTYLALDDANDGTQVIWGISGKMPFPENIFGLFMDMDAMLGKDFDKGLNKLKTIVETSPANQ